MDNDHWKPREYRFMSINSIITVPIDPENGTWLAYLSGSPAEAERGENEAQAIGELIMMLARDKHKLPAVRGAEQAFTTCECGEQIGIMTRQCNMCGAKRNP